VKVRNEDGVSVATKEATKQLRYIPITPRLKRLFLSEEIVKQMRWHHEGKRKSEDPDIMSHPADSEAWHTLNRFDPEFARDPRSVHLGLSTDGFQPHSTDSHPYSCWPRGSYVHRGTDEHKANVTPGWLRDYVAYVHRPEGTDKRKGLRFIGSAWPMNVR
jgi:hypothetical protein